VYNLLMYSIASTTAQISVIATDTGIIIAVVLAGLLGGLVALLGLGFAVRKTATYVYGGNPYDSANWDVYMKTNYPW